MSIGESTALEDYALLSNQRTAALVSRDGSVDWLCLPRFDSGAVFSAILGTPENGSWRIAIRDGKVTHRSYRGKTFVLETTWESPTGTAKVIEFLAPGRSRSDLVRRVECVSGTVTVEHRLHVSFSYGRVRPWFRQVQAGLLCTAGPDGVLFAGPGLESSEVGSFTDIRDTTELTQGEKGDWTLTWFQPWEEVPVPADPDDALLEAEDYWVRWIDQLDIGHHPLLERSLLVLRALTHSATGGIVAAPTASLPEEFGGGRNWDYRFTWLRDAALTVEVLVAHGLTNGARAWRNWLLRAVAGDPANLQIMYGIGGEREMPELELSHLRGYENSRPVRIGNGAADQYQADVVGEVMLALAALRDSGYADSTYSWALQKGLLDYTVHHFDDRDHGLWEMRGERHYFTHGRVMMWAAFNEGIRAVESHGYDGDVKLWRAYRDRLEKEIHEHGWSEERRSFTQVYGGHEVDAALLQLPHTGFISPTDERMLATVAAIEEDLVDEKGLVYRYRTTAGLDGLEGDEYPFLMCAFWLVEQYARSGRLEEARARLEMLSGITTDLGLLSEEYDPGAGRLAGNFPQAFSHLSLIRAIDAIEEEER